MLLEPEELKKSSQIDPAIVEFSQKNPSPPIDWTDATALQATMATVEAMTLVQLGPPESSLIEEEKQIPMRDGFESTIKIHRPATKPSGGSPLIVLFFGGGFVSGGKDQLTPNARAFVRQFGAVAITVSYRLAPQHKFPVGWNDAWDSTKWIAAHASELGADPSKGFIVGGVSAGGTQSAVVTNLSIEEKLSPPITGQWLSVPAVMDEAQVPEKYKKYYLAREHNKNAPILDDAAMNALKKHTEWDDNSPIRYAILFDTQGRVPASKLPPTYFQACGLDPIRDDALIYDEVLKEAGVKTKFDFYPGCPHAHWAFTPGIDISNKAISDIVVGFGWLLGKQVSAEDGLKAYAPASA